MHTLNSNNLSNEYSLSKHNKSFGTSKKAKLAKKRHAQKIKQKGIDTNEILLYNAAIKLELEQEKNPVLRAQLLAKLKQV